MSSRLQTARTIAGTVLLLFQIAAGQQSLLKNSSPEAEGQSSVTPDVAGGASSPDHDEMGNRRPLYRLRQSDTVDINFSFAPEFNQTITVRPDGFVSLRELPDAYVAGLTVSELQRILVTWYASRLHQPEITVTLKDFERPYFIVSGQVAHPGDTNCVDLSWLPKA
jgi:protein involved in polysaccharide export with SLBB domain